MVFEGYTGGGSKEIVDGIMSTGDMGHIDEEGRLFIDSREDDMIVSGGENVYPGEVEELLSQASRRRRRRRRDRRRGRGVRPAAEGVRRPRAGNALSPRTR